MTGFDYHLDEAPAARLGLVVLQADETIEGDFRRLMPAGLPLLVSRVPSGLDVTPQTLREMENHIPAAAALFPGGKRFAAIGYGCTSGTAEIGVGRVAELVGKGAAADAVTEPLSALIAACAALGVSRLAFLSPYVEEVSTRIRDVLAESGVESPVFGSFEESEEARVVRIAPGSITQAAVRLAVDDRAEAVFMSCTNLRTLDIIAGLEERVGKPVLSSNQVLAWHMCALAGAPPPPAEFGRLMSRAPVT